MYFVALQGRLHDVLLRLRCVDTQCVAIGARFVPSLLTASHRNPSSACQSVYHTMAAARGIDVI